jgi:ABC-type lipoprotein release transport system permease subunit
MAVRAAFLLALNALRRGNTGTSAVTIAIMTLSLINLLFMPILIDSMSTTQQQGLIDYFSGHVVILPKMGYKYIENPQQIMDRLERLPRVAGVAAEYDFSADFVFGDRVFNSGVLVIYPPDYQTVLKVHEHTEGDYLEEGDMNQIIIGKELAGTYDPIDPADNLLGSAYEGG